MKEIKYFAYGSNLDPDQMEDRGIKVKESEIAELPGWKLAFTIYSDPWGGGVADILPSSGEKVKGVIYTIAEDSLKNLDRYEGRRVEDNMERGMYRRQYIPVKVKERWETVLTYIVNRAVEYKRKVDLKPSQEYLETIISGAREHGLDKEYIENIKDILED